MSRSTVSRVINNDANVKETTRQRVLEVIQRLNYRPNMVARRLASGQTHIIGLVIPANVSVLFDDPYFPALIQGVTSACNARDYAMMLWLAEPEHERRTMNQIAHNGLLDGVIIASSVIDDPLHELLLEDHFPFVMVGRHPSLSDVSYVDVDNFHGAREAVSYLFRLGRRRIATITGPLTMIAGLDRRDGYLAALRERGLPAEAALIGEGDFTEAGGYHVAQRLLPAGPDAIFVASDSMARGALRALREKGVRVPEDVAIVGFDDVPFAAHTEPPLTTIRQPILGTGQMAVEVLLAMLQ
ncbi:MAG: LacI family DNA-binding transcriptional regulator, partial [Anaerolineales bacterium]|nr:LacI family DNA-binding transcriptional regulator [Anaerolineales bacterium]